MKIDNDGGGTVYFIFLSLIMLILFIASNLSREKYYEAIIEEQNQTQLLIKGLSGEIKGLNGEVQSLKADFTVLPNPTETMFIIEGWEPDK